MEPEDAVDPKTVQELLADAVTDQEALLARLYEIKKNTGGGTRELSLAITHIETGRLWLKEICRPSIPRAE